MGFMLRKGHHHQAWNRVWTNGASKSPKYHGRGEEGSLNLSFLIPVTHGYCHFPNKEVTQGYFIHQLLWFVKMAKCVCCCKFIVLFYNFLQQLWLYTSNYIILHFPWLLIIRISQIPHPVIIVDNCVNKSLKYLTLHFRCGFNWKELCRVSWNWTHGYCKDRSLIKFKCKWVD